MLPLLENTQVGFEPVQTRTNTMYVQCMYGCSIVGTHACTAKCCLYMYTVQETLHVNNAET